MIIDFEGMQAGQAGQAGGRMSHTGLAGRAGRDHTGQKLAESFPKSKQVKQGKLKSTKIILKYRKV